MRPEAWSAISISSKRIFGNGGDPYLPENDAALDVMHWTGHTGCVIVAPHLAGIKKKDVGLPHEKDATERQRRDGMCWRDPDEPYNGGGAFKVACRDERGVMVTIIADNYYGYCKKEVKTQISFAANLYGLCEEEHAGGAIAFATYVLGQDFRAANAVSLKKASFRDAMRLLGPLVENRPRGLRHRPQLSGYPVCAGGFRIQRSRGLGAMEERRNGNAARPFAPIPPTSCPTASGFAWRSNPAARLGGSWARARGERCATSLAPFRAAANRKSPNRSPM